jgi:hypothetical protein
MPFLYYRKPNLSLKDGNSLFKTNKHVQGDVCVYFLTAASIERPFDRFFLIALLPLCCYGNSFRKKTLQLSNKPQY